MAQRRVNVSRAFFFVVAGGGWTVVGGGNEVETLSSLLLVLERLNVEVSKSGKEEGMGKEWERTKSSTYCTCDPLGWAYWTLEFWVKRTQCQPSKPTTYWMSTTSLGTGKFFLLFITFFDNHHSQTKAKRHDMSTRQSIIVSQHPPIWLP